MNAAPTAVLDASALLALLNQEPGHEYVSQVLVNGAVSVVNWAEVVQKATHKNLPLHNTRAVLQAAGLQLIPLDLPVAEEAARLWKHTKSAGLSLADRICLALALTLKAPAITADTAWTKADIGVDVKLIR